LRARCHPAHALLEEFTACGVVHGLAGRRAKHPGEGRHVFGHRRSCCTSFDRLVVGGQPAVGGDTAVAHVLGYLGQVVEVAVNDWPMVLLGVHVDRWRVRLQPGEPAALVQAFGNRCDI
jgi:hypothetical protein